MQAEFGRLHGTSNYTNDANKAFRSQTTDTKSGTS